MRYVKLGLPEAREKKVKFISKLFSEALAVSARVWRWLVGGLNCFKAAEHRRSTAKPVRSQRIVFTSQSLGFYSSLGKKAVAVYSNQLKMMPNGN